MAKQKKVVKEKGSEKCHCKYLIVKLAAMAFLMFLLTVWPMFCAVLISLHWGWYLGITILLMGLGCMKHCCCKKK